MQIHFESSLLLSLELFNFLIAEIEADVCGNKYDVGKIEPKRQIEVLKQYFGCNAAEIAKLNTAHKQKALSLSGTGTI